MIHKGFIRKPLLKPKMPEKNTIYFDRARKNICCGSWEKFWGICTMYKIIIFRFTMFPARSEHGKHVFEGSEVQPEKKSRDRAVLVDHLIWASELLLSDHSRFSFSETIKLIELQKQHVVSSLVPSTVVQHCWKPSVRWAIRPKRLTLK